MDSWITRPSCYRISLKFAVHLWTFVVTGNTCRVCCSVPSSLLRKFIACDPRFLPTSPFEGPLSHLLLPCRPGPICFFVMPASFTSFTEASFTSTGSSMLSHDTLLFAWLTFKSGASRTGARRIVQSIKYYLPHRHEYLSLLSTWRYLMCWYTLVIPALGNTENYISLGLISQLT